MALATSTHVPSEGTDLRCSAVAGGARMRVLAADRDLVHSLEWAEAEAAVVAATAPVLALPEGSLELGPAPAGPATLGLLVLDGLLWREVSIGSERSAELIGAGDVIRPWADRAHHDPLRSGVEWCALSPVRVAVLDAQFVKETARWPAIGAGLMDRALRRVRAHAALSATAHVKRVDVRVLALFWQIADRWGKVTPRGIVVPVPLTHARLAALVGAQRPSVTTALRSLAERGLLTREAQTGDYLLAADRVECELERLCFSERSRRMRMVHRLG